MKQIKCRNCSKKFDIRPWPATWQVYCSKSCSTKHHNSKEWLGTRARGYNLKYHFGISQDEYDILYNIQSGKCKICEEAETFVNPRWNKLVTLAVDHDHITKKIRGLLCRRCNQVIGKFEDNPNLFDRASKYLRS